MKADNAQSDRESDWQKTPFANLVRYKPSRVYFARLRVKGKLIRRSLKTTLISVAKLRLADLEKLERQKAQSFAEVANGTMTFGDALKTFKSRLLDNPSTKSRTKEYYTFRIAALLRSWPEIEKTEITKITAAQCLDWSMKFARNNSSSSHNHTVSILRKTFEIAMEFGARYDNPGLAAKRVKEHTEKQITLPEASKFEELVAEVRSGGSRFNKPASELLQFLAYGGFRIGEAKFVTWADCDFTRRLIHVRGDPETGLKGRRVGESRHVPMIPDMVSLLESIKADRPNESPETPIMMVHECQKSINTASKSLGIKRITHHDLRHLFATRAFESGVDIPTVSRWLGHKDGGALAMKVYGHLCDDHSRRMAEQVRFSKPAPDSPPAKDS